MRKNSAIHRVFLIFKSYWDLTETDILQHLNEVYLDGYQRGYRAGLHFDRKQGLLPLPEKKITHQ